jgi:hypothetical protein
MNHSQSHPRPADADDLVRLPGLFRRWGIEQVVDLGGRQIRQGRAGRRRLGRPMRPHPDKTYAALFDKNVSILRRHHLERQKLYAEVLGVPASKLGAREGAA